MSAGVPVFWKFQRGSFLDCHATEVCKSPRLSSLILEETDKAGNTFSWKSGTKFKPESDRMAAAGQMYSNKAAEEAWLPDSRLPSHGSVEKLNSSTVNRLLMELLIYFGRAVLLLYPVYLTGYLGLSISWMLLCMVVITWWKKNRQWKDARIGTAIEFVDKETEVVHSELRSTLQMASWVCT